MAKKIKSLNKKHHKITRDYDKQKNTGQFEQLLLKI